MKRSTDGFAIGDTVVQMCGDDGTVLKTYTVIELRTLPTGATHAIGVAADGQRAWLYQSFVPLPPTTA